MGARGQMVLSRRHQARHLRQQIPHLQPPPSAHLRASYRLRPHRGL